MSKPGSKSFIMAYISIEGKGRSRIHFYQMIDTNIGNNNLYANKSKDIHTGNKLVKR